jgi:hypothetical protein
MENSYYNLVEGMNGKTKMYHIVDDKDSEYVKTVEVATFEDDMHAKIICDLMNMWNDEMFLRVSKDD